ncbi:hypothetical protein QJS10_CPA05g00779 [Acorus calamus]|uniref:Uncharacterized protein n=1 Tax=Acorus calamus TaxID=4465 RepID=A0AAV9EYP4_ACOCL|nr:hypothetical protein QJS10_CPA05g00779 [Acorus calamus]
MAIDDSMKSKFLNLMTLELCSVKRPMLRHNLLHLPPRQFDRPRPGRPQASREGNQQVADLFNEFATNRTPDQGAYVGIITGIHGHLDSAYKAHLEPTNASEQQLAHAHKLPEIHYKPSTGLTSPRPPPHRRRLRRVVLHPPARGPARGLCFNRYYATLDPYYDAAGRLVEEEFRTIAFPFRPVEGEDHTGPFEFVSEVEMGLDGLLDKLRSGSAFLTAKDRGVELLGEDVVTEFEAAWGGGEGTKVDWEGGD